MGNLFVVKTIFDSDWVEIIWYIFGRWEQLF